MNDPQATSRARRNGIIAWLLVAGLAVGLGLVALGGDGDDPSNGGPSLEPADDRPGLALDDVSQEGVVELSGLAIPEEASEFLTASLDSGSQLDVAFAIDATQVERFVTGSGLPPLEEGLRVVTHRSPLWELNRDDGAEVRGTTDVSGDVRRAVELVDTGGGTIEVHAVITSAA